MCSSDLEVLARLQFPDRWEAKGIVVVDEIEARQFGECHPLVEYRVGLTAEDLDRMAEIDESLREVAGVHPLAADVGLAAIGEIRDPQR